MKKGFFAALMCALVMVLLPAAVYAKDGDFGGGGGTSDNPYIIEDAKDLEEFRNIVNNGDTDACAELTDDIVLNENVLNSDGSLNEEGKDNFTQWTPIGGYSNRYTGTFDGNGHTISGIYINTNKNYQGLFGYIGADESGQIIGTVKNLGIVDSSISGGNNVGGIAGVANGAIDCHNEGTVSGSGEYIGGILGKGRDYAVVRCYNTGSVIGSGKGPVAGIAGGQVLGVSNSYNTGTISGNNAYGIVGSSMAGVINCYNIGEVSGNAISVSQDSGKSANNYYLKGCASAEIEEDAQGAEEKTFGEFASGEVAYLLQSGSDEQVWGQETDEDFPILTNDKDLRVYKVTFMVNGKEYAVAYGNSCGVLVMPDSPMLSGGEFKYWVDEDEEKFTKDSSVKEDMTVTAVVKEKNRLKL